MDSSPPVSSVHGILQERILEQVAISFPGDLGWDWTCISCAFCIAQEFFTAEPPVYFFFSGLILRLNTQISFLPFYLQKLLNRARFSLSEIEISVLKTVMMKIHIKIWTLSLEQDIEMLLSSSWWWNHLNLECDSFLGDLFDYYKIDIYTQTPISSWKGI